MTQLPGGQQRVLDFVRAFLSTNGYSPSFADIRDGMAFKSTNAVKVHLDALKRKKVIDFQPKIARTIRIL